MKKLLALLLALILVLGLVACAGNTATEDTKKEDTKTEEKTEDKKEDTKEEEKKEETKEEEKEEETTEEAWPMLEATVIPFPAGGFTPLNDTWGTNYYRDTYGVDMEIMAVDTTNDEAWNVFWAGGGYADIILPFSNSQANMLVKEELVRPIEYEWFVEYMPTMHKMFYDIWGSDEAIQAALNINGQTWCIPYGMAANGFNTAFRNDWLEAVGLSVPTTVEEYGEVLRAFTEDDPDGNGKDDTYGCSNLTYGLYNVAAAYGTHIGTQFLINNDSTDITTNLQADNYREALTTFSTWYQNGWIDPETLTDDRGAVRSKFANGTIGVYCDDPWWWELERGEIGPLQMLCATQGLDFATACSFTTAIENVYTGEPTISLSFAWINGQASVYFGTEASDELVIRMMQIIDEACRVYDGTPEEEERQKEYARRSWGVEGVNWEFKEDKGWAEQIQGITPEEQTDGGYYLFPVSANFNLNLYEGRDDSWNKQNYEDAMGMGLAKAWRGNNCTLPVLSGELGDKYTNVTDYASTSRVAFLTGDMDITDDAVWAEYCAKLDEYGLQDVLQAYKDALCS